MYGISERVLSKLIGNRACMKMRKFLVRMNFCNLEDVEGLEAFADQVEWLYL
jgi:hypothetical protein